MALLQAVEEHDHYSTGADGYGMDWAAAGAENDIDMEGDPEQLGKGGRRRRAAAKRPRYLEDSSSDSSSESCSIDSTGNRRYAADTEQELDSMALSPHKGSTHRARLHASRRGTSEDLHPSSGLYSRAAAAAGVGATGQRNRGRGPSPAPPKKHRWVAGANQWVTDDGLVVWPKVRCLTRTSAPRSGLRAAFAGHVRKLRIRAISRRYIQSTVSTLCDCFRTQPQSRG